MDSMPALKARLPPQTLKFQTDFAAEADETAASEKATLNAVTAITCFVVLIITHPLLNRIVVSLPANLARKRGLEATTT